MSMNALAMNARVSLAAGVAGKATRSRSAAAARRSARGRAATTAIGAVVGDDSEEAQTLAVSGRRAALTNAAAVLAAAVAFPAIADEEVAEAPRGSVRRGYRGPVSFKAHRSLYRALYYM